MEDIKELLQELQGPLRMFTESGTHDVTDIITNYDTCRALIKQIEEDEEYENSEIVAMIESAKSVIIRAINDSMQSIASDVYERIRDDLAKARTIRDRIDAIAAGKSLLDTFESYREHADHPFLRRIVGTIEAFESKLDDALQKEEEAEFRRSMAGIEYTASDKQVKYLLALGAKPRQLQGITKEKASAMITRLTKG